MSSNFAGLSVTRQASPKAKESRISKDGYSFNVNHNKWTLNKDVTISFQLEILALDNRLLTGFRYSLMTYAEELSASYTQRCYYLFQRFIRDTGSTEVSEETLLNWRAILGTEDQHHLGDLRAFLVNWHDGGQFGVSAGVVKWLEGLRISGGRKGVAVLNRCPYTGAFTETEVLAVNEELIRLWKEEGISFEAYSYISTVQATVRRPTQLRQLKGCDLIKKIDPKTGAVNFFLSIPRSKQRGGGFRAKFKKLAITEDLYLTLLNLATKQTQKLNAIFNTKLAAELEQLVPLFVDAPLAEEFAEQGIECDQTLLTSDILHLAAKHLGERYVKNFCRKQYATSERTDDIIHINARRFRYTRGTNLGRKGFGASIIAEALDHSDSQNVKVYTENTADTVQYIDRAIGRELAPFANAFMGRIIENLGDGERGDDPTAKIPNDDNEVVGACGTNDFCVNGYEACYPCRKFRPLLDAPHEKVLESLYQEKEERLKKSGSVQYASTKDRLILAVEYVVKKCKEIKVKKAIN